MVSVTRKFPGFLPKIWSCVCSNSFPSNKAGKKNIILSHNHTLKLDEHVHIVCKAKCVLKFVRSIVYHMVVVFCHYHFSGSYPYANMLFVENDKDKSNRDHLTSWPPNPYEEVLVHGHFSFLFFCGLKAKPCAHIRSMSREI